MSNRQITTDYQVGTPFQILNTFRTYADAANYVTALHRTHFLTDAELSAVVILPTPANR